MTMLICYGISPAITCSTHFILEFAWRQVVGTFCVRPNSSYLQLRHIPVSVALSDWKNLYSSSPVNGRVFPHSITSRIKFLGTQRYTWMGRSRLRVKYLTWEHNSLTPACVKPLTLDPKSGTLTIGHHTSTSLVIAAFDGQNCCREN